MIKQKELKILEMKFKEFLNKTKNMKISKAINLFKKEFKRNRRSYFRYKKNIKLNKRLMDSENNYRNVLNRRSKCYFCNKQMDLIIHHTNFNHNDNNKNNLAILCNNCHYRLHKLSNPKVICYHIIIKKHAGE